VKNTNKGEGLRWEMKPSALLLSCSQPFLYPSFFTTNLLLLPRSLRLLVKNTNKGGIILYNQFAFTPSLISMKQVNKCGNHQIVIFNRFLGKHEKLRNYR